MSQVYLQFSLAFRSSLASYLHILQTERCFCPNVARKHLLGIARHPRGAQREEALSSSGLPFSSYDEDWGTLNRILAEMKDASTLYEQFLQ